ncbi:MerR family transcriptional regulator [Roseococcus sp. SDR]|uniref:MerR family transcriptional regulator n=1 Tax=Roseococcus sp. SDR TaxID=2835532 RepID=UPI001BCEEAED|nr:MerR family transcriptional regulator [Roseococcus sp. SDR]MBV1844264.1 MerR family transcriptional regulator [Roseococcus sp. SDR]
MSEHADLEERPRLRKSAQAFRTISEAAEQLNVPQHVLRFWETKFPQLKPLKRAGGRRYYRPEDLALLKRISDLLYTQGYTIKGVQRLLDEGEPELPLGEAQPEESALAQILAELDAIAVALRRL